YAYQVMFPPPKPAGGGAGAQKTSTSPSAPSTVTSSVPPTAPAAGAAQQPAEATSPSSSAAPVVADTTERDIPVESPSVSAVFTTRGGALKSWRLKKYQDTAKQPLELIPHTVPSGTPRPFTLSVGDQAADAALANALFKPSIDRIDLTSGQSTLTFEYTDASGLMAKKEFVFSVDQPYAIEFSATVQ